MGLGGLSQDEEAGDGEEDASEDIHGSCLIRLCFNAAVGVVASGNLARPMAGSETESGAQDWELRPSADARPADWRTKSGLATTPANALKEDRNIPFP